MIKKSFFQPFLISLTSLILAFFFFIFSQYFKPIFALRILLVDIIGLFGVSLIFYFIKPNYKSIIKRTLFIVFVYFTLYELTDYFIFYFQNHFFSRGSRTDFVEAATAVITFGMTFIIALIVKFNQRETDSL
jgi:hypothetical protein